MKKHHLANCHLCPLANERVAKSKGPEDAKVAIVSRSPGKNDVQHGKPFSGPSGQVLDHMLNLYGVKREEVLTTNLVLCYSDNPPQEAIAACSPRLQQELKHVDTVIAAGAEAVNELIGKVAVKSARGIVHQKGGRRIIATNNPSAVLYDSDSFPNLVEDFKLALDPPPPITYPTVTTVTSVESAVALFHDLLRWEGPIAVDVEGHMPHLECIGFSYQPDSAFVVPRHVIEQTWNELKSLLETNKHWTWHNGVYDVKLLRRNSISTSIVDDTFPLSHVLDEREDSVHSLEYLSRTQLGWLNYEPDSVVSYKKTGVLPDDLDDLHTYNGYDCAATLQLLTLLKKRALVDNVWELYRSQSVPLMNTLVDLELRGFNYDAIAAADLMEEIVLPKLRALRREMQDVTGLALFNPSSPPQVAAWVYDTCGLIHNLKSTRKRSFDRATGKEVRKEIIEGRTHCKPNYEDRLLRFATLHEVYSQIDKQRGTYLEGLIKLVADDGKLYCTFNPCGTVTRRLSSRTPNFQNITRTGKDVVPGIRTLFKPSPGNVIVQADYSQAELRCIARFSGDSELLAIYRDSGRSLHKETAAAFYGDNYSKDEYVKSKNINFGVCYGQSAFAFAQMYQMPKAEAQRYIDAWFKRFPNVRKWIDSVHRQAMTGSPVVSPFGGKRRFWLITEENAEEVKKQAVNFLPQNTAAEFTIWSMCQLNALGIPVISSVHDSIICDVPQSDAMDVALEMKRIMESAPAKTIGWDDLPFLVDISISDISWGDVEEIEFAA